MVVDRCTPLPGRIGGPFFPSASITTYSRTCPKSAIAYLSHGFPMKDGSDLVGECRITNLIQKHASPYEKSNWAEPEGKSAIRVSKTWIP